MSSEGEALSTSHKTSGSRRVSAWVPLAAFAGTSIALAIPLVMLARQRNTVLRKALSEGAAPPRRSGFASTGPIVPKSTVTEGSSTKVEFSSPDTSEMLSAMSKVDFSTAIYAGKAFAIASGIVTAGGVALVFGVKTLMGVRDTAEFAERMRSIVRRGLPSLTLQIHRPPDAEEHDISVSRSPESEPDPNWRWDEAEKRLQNAYDKGGLPTWFNTATKELEAETKVERAQRQRESERT